jgi:hypothetical protein
MDGSSYQIVTRRGAWGDERDTTTECVCNQAVAARRASRIVTGNERFFGICAFSSDDSIAVACLRYIRHIA